MGRDRNALGHALQQPAGHLPGNLHPIARGISRAGTTMLHDGSAPFIFLTFPFSLLRPFVPGDRRVFLPSDPRSKRVNLGGGSAWSTEANDTRSFKTSNPVHGSGRSILTNTPSDREAPQRGKQL